MSQGAAGHTFHRQRDIPPDRLWIGDLYLFWGVCWTNSKSPRAPSSALACLRASILLIRAMYLPSIALSSNSVSSMSGTAEARGVTWHRLSNMTSRDAVTVTTVELGTIMEGCGGFVQVPGTSRTLNTVCKACRRGDCVAWPVTLLFQLYLLEVSYMFYSCISLYVDGF